MNYKLLHNIFLAESFHSNELTISVVGTSMFPTLLENDVVTVTKSKDYTIGDILVFVYKNNELIVHRLLKKEHDIYFCKGDNSFRLEDITYEKIVGKVTKVNNLNISPCPADLIEQSLNIHKKLATLNYDIVKLKNTIMYKTYKKQYLRRK